MSVTVSKADGVTVFTLTSDPDSSWPPLCQILKNLCYSPVCCTVSQRLRSLNRTSQTVLGTLQIMIGLLNIGLGLILLITSTNSWWFVDYTGFPYWLGALFIVFGIMCIVSEKYPSPCLVILTVTLNVAGVAFAITAIVLYSNHLANIYLWWGSRCDNDYNPYWYRMRTTTAVTPSPEEMIIKERCLEGQAVVMMLLRSISVVLIVLSVLELCITISSSILGIKSLRRKDKGKNESTDDSELIEPLLEEVTAQAVA
ncbi:membrane-spanning 4-domains subfamily A member 8-like [Pelmatolapia mariae]|uniref:membrane-spanning 4-domains subfamily A member 8-like n=1 Tax=Pelmatolapia mariae TaxID=158779 RepID=UPI002FE6856F